MDGIRGWRGWRNSWCRWASLCQEQKKIKMRNRRGKWFQCIREHEKAERKLCSGNISSSIHGLPFLSFLESIFDDTKMEESIITQISKGVRESGRDIKRKKKMEWKKKKNQNEIDPFCLTFSSAIQSRSSITAALVIHTVTIDKKIMLRTWCDESREGQEVMFLSGSGKADFLYTTCTHKLQEDETNGSGVGRLVSCTVYCRSKRSQTLCTLALLLQTSTRNVSNSSHKKKKWKKKEFWRRFRVVTDRQ